METVAPKPLSRTTSVQPAAVRYVQCKPVGARVPTRVQASLQVSSPKDSAEKEAESTARRITGMVVPESSVSYVRTGGGRGVFRQGKPEEKDKKLQRSFKSPYLARFAASGIFAQKSEETAPLIQRKTEGQPNVASNVSAEIQNSLAAGAPLPLGVRRFMEPRFRADFSKVKVHTGDKAAKLNRQLSAQAFAVGDNLFFGKDKFQPETPEGKELIAHELTHTIQQGAVVQRSEEVSVTQQAPVQVQRLGVSDALDYFADHANLIPGFRMFTIILGVNPINMSSVSRSPANILRALIEFIPGGALITQALDNYGIFDKIGTWVEQQIKSLGMIGSAIKQSVMDFIHSLSWTDIFDLGGVWDRAKRIFTEPIDRIKAFAVGLATGIINFIKDAILMPLAKLAEGTRGWDLLVAVLGKNPITNEPVTPTPEVLIGGFMKLIGQEEIWARVQETRALAKVWAWFQGAVKAVKGFVQQIPALAIAAFKSLELVDIVLLPRAFMKVAAVFGNFIGNFISWAGNAVWNLLEIIFDVVKPGALGYIKKTGAALKSILKNPLPFVGNLVKAAKLGFQNFAGNFLTHLKAGLLDWLVGALPGVYLPKAITLLEVGKFVLSILGISWAQIRGKIVKALGPNGEKIMAGLEAAFDVIKALITGGAAAAWEVIKEKLTNLKDMVIGGITDFIVDTVVTKAIPKLISMFIPGAGFISAIVSIYDTVMVFVNKIAKIIQVVTAFIDSIVAIAGGAIGAAASRVESILAGLLSLAINFLAGFVGLGKVADKIMGVIGKVRDSVDKALDAGIAWIIGKAKALFAKLFGKKDKKDDRTDKEKERDLDLGIAAAQALLDNKSLSIVDVRKGLPAIKTKYRMTALDLITDAKAASKETDHIHGIINPEKDTSKVEKDIGDWPVAVGDTIKNASISHRIEKVTALKKESITYTQSDKTGALPVTQPREFFMKQWDAGTIVKAGEMSAEEKRAELTKLYGAAVADRIMRRSELADNMAILDQSQAHHIIPVEIWGKEKALKALIEDGWDPNSEANGIALAAGFHGNHPAYTAYVSRQITSKIGSGGAMPIPDFETYVKSTLIPDLVKVIGDAKSWADKANKALKPGEKEKTLNDYCRNL